MYFTGNGIMNLAFPASLVPRGAETAQRTADAVPLGRLAQAAGPSAV